MVILLSHPSGNANVRQLASGLASAGLLAEVATGLALRQPPSPRWPGPLRRELARRQWPADTAPFLRGDPLGELLRLALVRTPPFCRGPWPARLAGWQYRHHDLRVAHRLARRPAASLPRAVYVYEDCGAATLAVAQRRGLASFLELPTLHSASVRRWQAEEAARHPEWRPLLPSLHEPAWKLRRKAAELAAARWIIVASSLTRDSCLEAGIAPERLLLLPYGAPQPLALQRPEQQRPIVLYVGRLNPAKGVHHLVAAWRRLELSRRDPSGPSGDAAELWLVGASDYPRAWHAALPPSVRCFGSLPPSELPRLQAQAQLFVMPSLLEGYGLAVQEAMASALPVLLTDRCGNRDLITPGANGWIVPSGDPASLAAVLVEALADPQRCRAMGAAAQATVARYSWADYHRNAAALLQSVLER
jgi:starch synthase